MSITPKPWIRPVLIPLLMGLMPNAGAEDRPLPAELEFLSKRYQERVEEIEADFQTQLRNLWTKLKEAGSETEAGLVIAAAAEVQKGETLCQVVVKTRDKVIRGVLNTGVLRIHGNYEPQFNHVDQRLQGAAYLVAGEKLKQTYQVHCLKDGYIYLYGLDSWKFPDPDLEPEPLTGIFHGPYIDQNRLCRIWLTAGKVYEFSGYECNLIAAEISL